MMWENGRLSSDGDPTSPPNFTHGRTSSNVSRGSGLRNEVKFADDGEHDDPNDTSNDAFIEAPLYGHGSPTKAGAPQVYSHNHSSSRSNLAPVNSNPAYQQGPNSNNYNGRSRQDGGQYGQAGYGRYDAPVTEEYADYYSRQ
jgi:hypothetical protein